MLELLNPQPGENILEIGYGSGWQTALLAATGANIYAIERIKKLCEWGKENVERLRKDVSFGSIQFFCQDGAKGLPEIARSIGSPHSGEAGGFDKIIVAAALQAAKIPSDDGIAAVLPSAWKDQLKIGGSIVAPIEHSIFLFTKKAHNQFDEREYSGFAFVPLVEEN